MSRKSDDFDKPKYSKDAKGLKFSRTNTDMVSYEDLLIAQYLEELRKAKSEMKKKKDVPASPYTQKLPHSDYGYKIKRRPQSASFVERPSSGSSNKPKIDAKFIADPNMWDPATPRSDKHSTVSSKKFRPASAPVRRKSGSRPVSASSNLSWFYGRGPRSAFTSRPWSGRRIRSQYKRQPQTIRVTAFKNGSKEKFIRVAAPTMKTLLEFCTDKLNLPFAARRVFLEDGVEVFEAHDIPLDSEVYISTGENYKDPLASEKRNLIIKNGSKWTLSGVLLPDNGRKKTKTAKMSKRMKALVERKRVRIVVYRNGKSTEPVEIVADLSDIQGFLTACTGKLDLRCHARILYDWEGNEINNLAETPILDDCLQPGGTAVLGPLWVSVGEGFSPSATIGYITSIRQVIKIKLQDAERYYEELSFSLNDEKEKVTITAILSMSDEELYETQEMAEREIEQLKETLRSLNEKVKAIKSEMDTEQAEGSNYRMSHIKKISADDRIVGLKGLRLRVYENGFYDQDHTFYFNLAGALRGVNNDKELVLKRLLDELSFSCSTRDAKNPKLAPVAQKIFDEYGTEIKDVTTLNYDQEIWVSHGEPHIQPFTYCIQAVFDRASGYAMSDGKTAIIREQLTPDHISDIKDDHREWNASIGFPPTFDMIDSLQMGGDEYIQMQLAASGLDPRAHFLQAKEKKHAVLYPEVTAYKKVPKGDKAVWPSESQVWVISKKGYIYSKSMPSLCLAASDMKTELYLPGKEETTAAFVVTLQKYMASNPHQQWIFNNDGTISSVAHQELVLTYSGAKFGDEENYKQPEGVLPGHKVYLIITDRLSKKEALLQRFALKQERFDNLGQWKFTDASNPEWNKLAYSWPVKEDGTLNEEYDWPMEGYIIPNAPPLHKGDRRQSMSGAKPMKLMVVKNGERDMRTAVPIVVHDFTNLMKYLNKEKGNKKNKRSKSQERNMTVTEPSKTDVVEVDAYIHCRDLTIRELEFMMFLDYCTSMLNLPFAARRLFDKKGNEHFDLQNLNRNDLVYVSCGETWTDPRLTRAEQQRRFLLSQLSQDVAKIRQFCALRNPENYVVEIDGNLSSNTGILLNKQWDTDEEERDFGAMDSQSMTSSKKESSKPVDDEDEDDDVLGKSAHAISHQKAEQRLNSLKWPWERLVNVDKSLDMDDPEAQKYTDRELYERYKPRTLPKTPRKTLQQFIYEDGYIACAANRDLVLGVLEQEGRVNQVMLVKRKPGDINQIWMMKENGEIRSKHNSRLVFTVAMPANEPFAEDEDGRPLTFSRCPLTIQGRRTNVYGKAHQRWHYNADTGYIHAFHTNRYDKEITAANKADVCTYSIAAQTKIDQPGYLAEVPVATPTDRISVREIMVCTSCARAMRGRYKLQKLPDGTEFICAMGEAKKLKLQQIGSFRVLNGKVDLSTHESELTLQKWEETLCNLREETSVRCIAKEINAAKTVKTVKILAYKNGEGRMRQGELICGSSIEGLLNQCTHRLSLTSAARKIFTEDGTMILEVEDIIDWAVENYKSLMVDQLERILHGKPERAPSPTGQTDELYLPYGTVYKNVTDICVDAVSTESVKFSIKAACNAHIGLFTNDPKNSDNNIYDVVIGGWGNKQSVIRNVLKGKPMAWCAGEFLDKDEYRDFWITWKGGKIQVGKGNVLGKNIFMEWRDQSPRKINHVGVVMDAKNDGFWMFNRQPPSSVAKVTSEPETQSVPIHTSKELNFVDLASYGIDTNSTQSMTFKVKAKNDAHIGLFTDVPDNKTTEFYQIAIGGWKNTGSIIRNVKHGQPKFSDFSGNFLSENEYRDFWVSWSDGIIRVGYGLDVGENIFMEYDDPEPYRVNYASISTGYGSEGDWIFYINDQQEPQERGEGEGQDSPAEGQNLDTDAAEVDEKEREKVSKERDELLQQVSIPSVDTILRYPIEVWVSSGREFVAPEVVESKSENRKKKRQFRSSVSMELDIEKHCLRQMKGRRYEDMNPGEYKSTRSSKQPVIIEGNWQDPTVEEQMKHDTVHKLETHLAEVKTNQRERPLSMTPNTSGRLYKQPDTKRIMVYPNGETIERAVYIWGDTLQQLLDNAGLKLGMWQKVKLFYNMEGKLIENFNDIERDQLLCASPGKTFQKPQGTREGIEIKANWSRARKQYGPTATDLVVDPSQNPKVDVDPFGPPELTLPQDTTGRIERPKTAKPVA